MAESGGSTQWPERPDNDIIRRFVEVPTHMKGYVIRKQFSGLQEIMQESGAEVIPGSRQQAGFTVIGNERQIELAATLILEKVEDVRSRMEWERVDIEDEFKRFVIDKQGAKLREICDQSGVKVISKDGELYIMILGSDEQRKLAKVLIGTVVNEVQQSMCEGGAPQADLVEVPDQYKGLVIGKWGDNLRIISTQTGAKVISRDNELYIVSGTNEQRQLAKIHIKMTVNLARLKGVENEFNKAYRYLDDWNLPADCRLKLEPLTQEDRIFLPGPHAQYRLRPAEAYEQQNSSRLRDEPSYLLKLKEAALESLRQIKHEMETKDHLMLDMWCHFGLGIIRGPDEEEADEEWTVDEANEKFQQSSERDCWRTAFNQGVDVNEKIFDDYPCQKSSEEFLARYDLTFLTPCAHELRCKVWVAKQTVEKKLEDLQVPFSDVKNILEEIHFEDEATRSRCRGWLVLPSRKYLQADILFPGCEFDCRLTIRGRTESGLVIDYLANEDVRRTLSRYLSELTVTEDGSGLHLTETNKPEGFHLIHKRYSRRSLYEISEGFKIILSRESTWRSEGTATEETRESTDLHIHCKEWDRLLGSGVWEPEAIVRKMPEFLAFVKEVQGLVVSKESGLASAVPPEILARGPLAVDAYNKALADGKTSVKRVPIMLIGQDRAGKTSLKKSLKGISFEPEEDSTIGIVVDPSHFKVTTEIWRTGTKRDQNADEEISFDHHAAMWIVDNMEKRNEGSLFEMSEDQIENSSDFDGSVIPKQPDPAGKKTDEAAEVQMTSEPEFTVSGDASQLSSRSTEQNLEPFDNSSPSVPEAVATVTEKLLQGGWEDNRNDIYSTVWDFAGQSVYYETHPLFLTARAIYCLVYDLSLNPRGKAKAVVKQGVYQKYQDTFNLKTNLDYLDFWMMSVASLASNQSDGQDVRPKSEVLPDKIPVVFLVCTHADKPYEDRNPLEFAREIFGCLKRKPYGAHLHDVFVVDNTKSGTQSECSEVISLRKEVLAVAKNLPHINETIPIKWLKFDQAMNALKEKGSKFISLEEAKHIASTGCNIKEEKEAKALIDYLHDLRSLFHFDDSPELNKLVVLDVQWLIDVFKKVITVRPYDCKEKKVVDMWCKLEKEGIMDEELLTHVLGPLCSNNESRASFIRIMEKFSLLCPWPSETSKSFIVPSMLKTHPGEKVLHLVTRTKIPSLFIKFQNGSVPAGLFCRLVLKFLQWGHRHFLRAVKPELFQKFARFFTSGDKVCSVIFACHTSSVEVVIVAEDDHDTATFTCAGVVCRQVDLMLESMRNEFQWLSNMRYEMSVLCPVCSQGGAIENCRSHDLEWCNQEQCLHFWSLPELFSAKETVICTKSPFAQNTKVHTKEFTPWFAPSGHQELHPTPPIATSQGAATLAGISDQPLKVTLLASEWGSAMGGLSTLNKKLAMFLAKHNQVNVTVLVPQDFCDEAHKRNAKKHNVTIREAQTRPGYDCLDWLGFPPEDLAIDVVLGHGVKLGKQVQAIRRTHHCNWIQVVHTAPEELGMYKDYSKAIAKGQEKKEDEVGLCKLANLVVAVGPKLTETYSSYLRSCKKQEDIFQLTPGVFHEFSAIKQGTQDGKNFKVLIFGRGDLEDFVLKGYDTAAKAVALLDSSYRLLFVGASEGKEEEVKDKLLQSGVSERQLIVRTFVKSEEEMKVLFCEVDLAIMPSRTDGFGLTALEALSAGLPILVSSNSGFGEALRELPTGKSHLVESDDPEKWADAIASVRQKKRADRLKEAEELRTSYGERYSWENQCEDLVKKIFSMVHAGKPK